MVGHQKIFISLFILSLFSLTVLQVSLKVSQSRQPTQILGATTNGLSCTDLYQFYQQQCGPPSPVHPTPSPFPQYPY